MRVAGNAWSMCGNHEDCVASNRRSDSRHLGGGPGPSRTLAFVLVSTGQGEVPTWSNRCDCGAIKTVDRMSATVSEVTVKRQNSLQICLRAFSMRTQFRQDSRPRDAVKLRFATQESPAGSGLLLDSPGSILMADILLIDDDPALIPRQVRLAFPAHTHCVVVARTGAEGLARVRTDLPDVILLDLRLPDQSGLEIYQAIRQVDGRIPVIFITLARSADSAIEAMRQGAYDYLFKPLDLQELRRVVNEALEVGRRMRRPAAVAETPPDPDFPGAIVGTCPAMREVYKSIGRVAAQNLPVLITGESGTGKELVARAIYQHGPRARAPYRALNCAAIPESLLESELFGHERGAFTGADRKRIGKFEQCNGGTLFLDEVGDMTETVQAKMLRLLQDQEFERVGGNELVRTDVRLIGATHRDLKAWSAEGKFETPH